MKTRILRLALFITMVGLLPLLWTSAQADDFNRSSLPIPDQPFKGKTGLRPEDSVKDFPKEVTAPGGAPNILNLLIAGILKGKKTL
jgi:hypothetical protein